MWDDRLGGHLVTDKPMWDDRLGTLSDGQANGG